METEAAFSTRFKYVETTGQSLIHTLGVMDPWETPCNREQCFPCQTREGKCMSQGVNYKITCLECKKEDKETVYWGESARTGYDRGWEHWNALKRNNKESPLVEHMLEDHPNVPYSYAMEVVSNQARPLSRQVEEAANIEFFRGHKILNRRGEWGQNLPQKLAI